MARGLQIGWFGSNDRQTTASVHNKTFINLNVSLNGDFNLRNFEVLAAGGFLLTDRLSPASGQSAILRDGVHCRFYTDIDDCERWIRHYSEHPDEAEKIARQGYDYYWENWSPKHQIERLHTALANRKVCMRGALSESTLRTLAAYQNAQEQLRLNPAWRGRYA
jgi:spore maturation protein CgeB